MSDLMKGIKFCYKGSLGDCESDAFQSISKLIGIEMQPLLGCKQLCYQPIDFTVIIVMN